MGIKTTTNSDGSVNVSTTDGINLVSNTYAQLSYSGGAQNGSYGNITIQDVNPANGNLLGSPQALDPHLIERLAQGHDRHARPGAGRPFPEPGQPGAADRADLQRPVQCQRRLSAAHLADRP